MRYKYAIHELDCANCAREVEETLTKDSRLKNVSVNFNTSKVSFDAETSITLDELNKLVQKAEPEAYLTETKTETETKTKTQPNEAIETDNGTSTKTLSKTSRQLLILALALFIGIVSYFAPLPLAVKILGYLISYSLLLYHTTINAIKLLIKSRTLNENALITISCIGALCIGEVLEGMMVITLYTIGKILEARALDNSRHSIQELLDLKQPYANLYIDHKLQKVTVDDIKVGNTVVVKKGEKVPVDGVIIKGETTLDLSALTGESLPVKVSENSTILSGAINIGNVVHLKAEKTYAHSTVAKILELLEDATNKKAKTETVVAKISKVYTPIIILLSLLTVVILPLAFHIQFTDALYRSLTFLVISCPCAIAISVPLSYFTGIGTASKYGILIKGSNYLDNLSSAKNIIFDKTGTLTSGDFAVTKLEILDDAYSEKELIDLLVAGETLSNHPIASSVLKLRPKHAKLPKVQNFREVAGQGITYKVKSQNISVGNSLLCPCQENSLLHLHINSKHVASITISDQVKPSSTTTIQKLKSRGLTTYMFTGDKNSVAKTIGHELGIDHIYAEMLPTDKFHRFETIAKTAPTIFVGDGINDAPVLRRADIGIAMGAAGSESAIEAADIVIMNDDLMKIPYLLTLSDFTKHIIYQNLIFAIAIKLIILTASLFGLANMWLAVFADTGVTLLTILNTLRILRKSYTK